MLLGKEVRWSLPYLAGDFPDMSVQLQLPGGYTLHVS